MTILAPSDCSEPVTNGSTALIASTRCALSAAAMLGNGTTTYFTDDGLTPACLSTAFVVTVWMLLVRLTAMVFPSRPGGPVMCELGRARIENDFGVHAAAAARTRTLNVPWAWPSK